MTRILVGDALERLRELPDGSVHCCVTSPPYWGLRSYEGDTWEGGDPSCDHARPSRLEGHAQSLTGGRVCNVEQPPGCLCRISDGTCDKCGATR